MTIFIAEISGKDSVAAVHKFIQEAKVDKIIPTIVKIGTEYGDNCSFLNSVSYLKECAKEYNIIFGETVLLHDEKLWNSICIKPQYKLQKKFGFFTPCIMCHLFAHLLRIPILLKYKGYGIITGERFSHEGKLKVNQHPLTIKCFNSLFNKYKISLIQPLINIADTNIVDKEIEDYALLSHVNDVKCILSDNLEDFSLLTDDNLFQLQEYLDKYIYPIGDYILGSFLGQFPICYDSLRDIIERGLQ